MEKPRNRWLDFAVYAAVRAFVAVMQALPLNAGYGFARRLAKIAFWIDKRHRNVALANLTAAFGDRLDDARRRRLTLGVYEHFFAVLIEMLHAPRKLRCSTYKRYIVFADMEEAVRRVTDRSRPCILATGHVGNWEVAGFLLAAIAVRSFAIARTLDNPYLDRFLKRFREYTGQTILSKNDDYDKIVNVLENRGVLVTLGDQSAGPRGYFVDFFGRPASTHRALALLALQHDAPILVSYGCRSGRGFRYTVGCAGVIDPRDFADDPNAALRMTAEYTRLLEVVVRRWPNQYLWLHNRWKHEPPVRKKKAA